MNLQNVCRLAFDHLGLIQRAARVDEFGGVSYKVYVYAGPETTVVSVENGAVTGVRGPTPARDTITLEEVREQVKTACGVILATEADRNWLARAVLIETTIGALHPAAALAVQAIVKERAGRDIKTLPGGQMVAEMTAADHGYDRAIGKRTAPVASIEEREANRDRSRKAEEAIKAEQKRVEEECGGTGDFYLSHAIAAARCGSQKWQGKLRKALRESYGPTSVLGTKPYTTTNVNDPSAAAIILTPNNPTRRHTLDELTKDWELTRLVVEKQRAIASKLLEEIPATV